MGQDRFDDVCFVVGAERVGNGQQEVPTSTNYDMSALYGDADAVDLRR